MASASARNWLFPIRVVLISAGVVSIAMALKASAIPLVTDFCSSYFPPLQSSIVAWLRPPFLYLIINCIIIAIAATSRFNLSRREAAPLAVPDPPERGVEFAAAGGDARREAFEDKRVVTESGGCLTIGDGDDEAEERVDSRPPVVQMDSASAEVLPISGAPPAVKSPVSSRFNHRKSLSVISGGGRAPRARDGEGHETMEATWKAITAARALTPTAVMRHLSRSDTWDDQQRQMSSLDLGNPLPPPPPPPVRKSERFDDRREIAAVNLRKEPSLSPEELKRRVEAFIEKFNEEMRLQRLESLDQKKEMIGRGL